MSDEDRHHLLVSVELLLCAFIGAVVFVVMLLTPQVSEARGPDGSCTALHGEVDREHPDGVVGVLC